MEEDTKRNVSGENLDGDRIEHSRHSGIFRGSKRLDNWCLTLTSGMMWCDMDSIRLAKQVL